MSRRRHQSTSPVPARATPSPTPTAITIARPGGYDRLVVGPAPGGTIGANLDYGTPACPADGREGSTPWPGVVAPPGREDLVLVDVAACGVNYADVCVRWGLYESANKLARWPITPGFEFSGRVAAVGAAVTDLAVGDNVFGVTMFGGYSTRVTVPRNQLWGVPPPLSLPQAAGMLATYMTAWYAMFELAGFTAGPPASPPPSVLVHSAAGGVGSMLVQLGKVAGAHVVGVVGRASKVEYAKSVGCDVVIDKSSQRLWEVASEAAPGGYQAVFDANGVATLGESFKALAPTGRLIVYGFHSMLPRKGGRISPCRWLRIAWDYVMTPRFNPLDMTATNRSVMAFNLSFLFNKTAILEAAMSDFEAWVGDGRVAAPRVTTYPLEDVAEAHAAIESGTTVGKLVLTTG